MPYIRPPEGERIERIIPRRVVEAVGGTGAASWTFCQAVLCVSEGVDPHHVVHVLDLDQDRRFRRGPVIRVFRGTPIELVTGVLLRRFKAVPEAPDVDRDRRYLDSDTERDQRHRYRPEREVLPP